jgi:geranylgeranyl diphosphate synthase type I
MSSAGPLAHHLPVFDAALRAALADGPPELLRLSRYVLGWESADGSPAAAGGKRLRPLLCMEVAAACGASPVDALPGAVAVELVHNFSLVHDDIQDRDLLRHGRPTAWQLIGEAQAINLGNFLYTRGLRQLAESRAPGAQLALAMLFEAVERMVAGQWLDLAFESRSDVTEAEYLDMVAGKTGALLGAAAGIGAALAGASREQVERLRQWGERLGIAFQVHDDYLGAWGDVSATGKSTSSDIVRRKKTLPVVLAMATVAGEELRELYRSPAEDPAHTARIMQLLERAGARERTRELANSFAREAEALLASTGLTPGAAEGLYEFGRLIVDRDR